ncbi:MAG: DUF2849 domain-containing protein [Pseudomonadota bacterium]
MSLKQTKHLILTGYDIKDGHIIFWDGQKWVTDFDQAIIFDDANKDELPPLIKREELELRVTNAYEIFVERSQDNHRFVPVRMREKARLSGPSIDYMPKDHL